MHPSLPQLGALFSGQTSWEKVVGLFVGFPVGLVEGFRVGLKEGAVEGEAEGAVGLDDGLSVGFTHESPVQVQLFTRSSDSQCQSKVYSEQLKSIRFEPLPQLIPVQFSAQVSFAVNPFPRQLFPQFSVWHPNAQFWPVQF